MTSSPTGLFIDGERVEPSTGRYFSTTNPATEGSIAEVALGDSRDIERAVAAARRAFDKGSWPGLSPTARRDILLRMASLLEERTEEFAVLETTDTGKPIAHTRSRDLPFAVELLRYYAGWADKIHGTTLPLDQAGLGYTLREPVGVVAAITPWNSPLVLSLMKIAPALAAGNVVVHKPASWTPLTAYRFAELALEAGLPPGALNVVTGPGSTAGSALVAHAQVDKVSFTGETTTGKQIMCDGAGSMKRVSLELGGKSPNIVFADAADLDTAAGFAARGFCTNQGQICWAGSRLFVEEAVHARFVDKLVERVRADWRIGDPMHASTSMGPVISGTHRDRVEEFIEEGRKEGADMVLGGKRPDMRGFFVQPTVFDNASNRMKIAREEIFGPVLTVIPFTDVDDLVAQANDTCYGLVAGLWTTDITRAHRLARVLRAGSIWINTYGPQGAAVPFGGVKQSGLGRELGQEVLQLYTETKSVWVNLG
ncbi:MAG: aldehyde dehydrogenase family protein [Burkholderiaceae bacterium]|nr:aldehyde dehydrogenase family protein [Burkholderiaceae bacterium]